MATRPKPTTQAINGAQRFVRQETGDNTWRYDNGTWKHRVMDVITGVPRDIRARPDERTRFNAILRYFETVYPDPNRKTFGQYLSSGVAGAIASARAGASSAVVGAASGAIGGVAGAAMSTPGRVVHGAAGLTGAGITTGLGLAGGALAAFAVAVKASKDALLQHAHDVVSISDQTGANYALSQTIVNRFKSLGISSERTAGMFGSTQMNPVLFNARARVLGGPQLEDPNFAENLSRWYQAQARESLGGFLTARAKLDSLFGGQAPAEALRIANTSPDAIRQQTAYGNQVQQKLGINPETIRRAAEDLPMLQTRVSVFVDSLKIKFASELLPTFQGFFGGISELLMRTGRMDGIVGALQKAGRWMFVEGPTYALKAGDVLLAVFKGISDGFFALANAGVGLLQGFASKQGILYTILNAGAGVIDFLFEFGAQFSAVLAFVSTTILNEIARIANLPGLKQWLQAQNPVLAAALQQTQNPLTAYQQALTQARPTWNAQNWLGQQAQNLQNSGFIPALQNQINANQNAVNAGFAAAQSARNAVADFFGTEGQRGDMFDRNSNGNVLREIAFNTRGLIPTLRDVNGRPIVFGNDTISRISAYVAEDAGRLGRRRG